MNESRPRPPSLAQKASRGRAQVHVQTDLGDFLGSVTLSGHFTSQSLSSHAAVMRMKGDMCEPHIAPDTVSLAVRFSLD